MDENHNNLTPPPAPQKLQESPLPSKSVKKPSSKSIGKVLAVIIIICILLMTFGVIGYFAHSKYNVFGTKDVGDNMAVVEFREKESDKNDGTSSNQIEDEVDTETSSDAMDIAKNPVNSSNSRFCTILKNEMAMASSMTDEELIIFLKSQSADPDNINTDEQLCVFGLFLNYMGNVELSEDMSEAEVMNVLVDQFIEKYSIEDTGLVENVIFASLANARKKAQAASVKSSVSSTLPGAILCMDDNGYLSEPREGVEICSSPTGENHGTWPVISDKGAQWGGCEMSVQRDGAIMIGFTYCATLPDGTIAQCEETGCAFGENVNANAQ